MCVTLCDALHVVAGVGAVNALFCGCDDCVVCPATSSRLVLTLAPMPHVAEKVTYKLTFEEISQLNERKDQLKKEHAKVRRMTRLLPGAGLTRRCSSSI